MSKVIAVCTSEETGTRKAVVDEVMLREEFGIVGDAHASGSWHRQVSLLAIESIDKMRRQGYEVNPGDFAENLTTEGIELFTLPIGTRLNVGDEVALEVTQIGKECHTGCAIFQQLGKCVMPKEGIFARVIRGGHVRADNEITLGEQ
jgi:MOSC domain-containing protein YiiM